ncbi:MAG: PAS domain S-box protein, partial [Desulfobacteraceae bacterium]|nr:PAS domain S-box protein [Desulfobacteraceae bacterium]
MTRRSSLFIAGGDSDGNFGEPFEYIVENSNQGILVVIGDKPVYFNKKILNYTGYSYQDLFEHSVTEFIHPDDKDNIIRNYIWKRQSTHPGEAATFRVVKKNGNARWVELNTAIITWEGRNATLCFLSDITTHKKFEKELSGYRNNLEEIILKRTNELQEASKQLCAEISRREKTESVLHENSDTYRKILDDIHDGFFEVGLTGKMLFFNKGLCEISGYPAKEMAGLHYKTFTSAKTAKSLYKVFNTVYSSGKACRIKNFEIIRKDKSTGVIAISVSLARDKSGKPVGFRGICRDVTQRIMAEQSLDLTKAALEKRVEERTAELINTNTQLLKAKETADQSAQAKTEFLANISHEIRTPLNAIIGMSELVMKTEDPSKQKEYLKIVRSSSESLLDLVNDILDFSNIDSGKLDVKHVQFNLQDVIDNLADLFLERNMDKGLELIIDIRSTVPEILT